MAKLDKIPSKFIIDGFKGAVDFYQWKGIPVARKWPRKFTPTRTPALAAAQDRFAYVNQIYSQLSLAVVLELTQYAAQTTMTPKDILVKAYIKGLFEIMPPEYYATEETQLTISALLQHILNWAAEENTLLGVYDLLKLEYSTVAGAGGNVSLNSVEVPAGAIWVVTSVVALNATSPCSYILLAARDAAGWTVFHRETAPLADIAVNREAYVPLIEGGSIRATYVGVLAGDVLELRIVGFKMRAAPA